MKEFFFLRWVSDSFLTPLEPGEVGVASPSVLLRRPGKLKILDVRDDPDPFLMLPRVLGRSGLDGVEVVLPVLQALGGG